MARLIPALCPQCGGQITLSPSVEWVTCSFCRTTSFIETPARRHAVNHPPPHVPVVRVTPERFPISVVVILAVFCLVGVSAVALPRTLSWALGGAPRSHSSYLQDASPLRNVVAKELGGDPQV
jgi:hypothetical protein